MKRFSFGPYEVDVSAGVVRFVAAAMATIVDCNHPVVIRKRLDDTRLRPIPLEIYTPPCYLTGIFTSEPPIQATFNESEARPEAVLSGRRKLTWYAFTAPG